MLGRNGSTAATTPTARKWRATLILSESDAHVLATDVIAPIATLHADQPIGNWHEPLDLCGQPENVLPCP